MAVLLEDVLTLVIGAHPATQIRTISILFQNPLVAGLYLSAPYLFMLYLDLRSRKEAKRGEEKQKEKKTPHLNEVSPTEHKVGNVSAYYEAKEIGQVCQHKSKGRINFLHGVSAMCFLLAIFTFWLSDVIPNIILPASNKFVYIITFTVLGTILLGMGCYLTSIQKQALTYTHEKNGQQHKPDKCVQPFEKESAIVMQKFIQEPWDASAKESIGPPDKLIKIPIKEQICGLSKFRIIKFDVRHPKNVVDSQC